MTPSKNLFSKKDRKIFKGTVNEKNMKNNVKKRILLIIIKKTT